ncbi:(Fe-S)-binding protein [Nitriliruptoria bacterium AS10]|nr:(Fe-S)-binding protein [Salsipaludibacter albus]
MILRIVAGLVVIGVGGALALRRGQELYELTRAAAPAPERSIRNAFSANVRNAVTNIFGNRKLLRWSLPGVAHFWVMWAFFVLQTTLLEAAGELFVGPSFQLPFLASIQVAGISAYDVLGFLQDAFGVLSVLGIAIFAVIRWSQDPRRTGRSSRFAGSNLRQGWWVLAAEFLVIWTIWTAHGIRFAEDHAPTQAAFVSSAFGDALAGIDPTTLEWVAAVNLVVHLAIVLWFLNFTLRSKHLHILTIPFQELSRDPERDKALGKLSTTPIDMEAMDEDTVLGVGAVEQFTFDKFLDFMTCTECGRCQSQCPAWNTGKPLSPKMLVMDLRDHMYDKGDWLLGRESDEEAGDLLSLPLVSDSPGGEGVIDYDVLWSCTTCGACVEECPVDIQHVDTIMDMRRYKAMMESSFPQEAGVMLRNVENSGDPWGVGQARREDWTDGLDFDIPRAVPGTTLDDDVTHLLWVGCSGSVDDRSKKITVATAELLHDAGVSFAILGNNETCTGDPARRLGMEYIFQMLAEANVENLKSVGADKKTIITRCAHCFNAIKNEYPDFDGHFEVVHHSQLLARLVEEGRLEGTETLDQRVTYHDPCYLGRHNEVYDEPRAVVAAVPGIDAVEMERSRASGFCCGAGGARMYMEEDIGERVNVNRVKEVIDTGADIVATGCPFCVTMLTDGIADQVQDGVIPDGSLEVLDIAEVLSRGRRRLPLVTADPD